MKKKVKGLVEYALAQVGRPYWYGTCGQMATAELYQKKKRQYPAYYTADDYEQQFGQKVHDCGGLAEGYLMGKTPDSDIEYDRKYDYTANGLYAACKEKGDIRTMPDIAGLCVFYSGHMGIYVGDGKVVEARGHRYGVVITKLDSRPWKYWGKHPDIDYTPEYEEYTEVKLPVLKKGTKTADVGIMQTLLLYQGYSVGSSGVDCSFGGATQKAIKALQVDQNLPITGICGQKEWQCLLKGEL